MVPLKYAGPGNDKVTRHEEYVFTYVAVMRDIFSLASIRLVLPPSFLTMVTSFGFGKFGKSTRLQYGIEGRQPFAIEYDGRCLDSSYDLDPLFIIVRNNDEVIRLQRYILRNIPLHHELVEIVGKPLAVSQEIAFCRSAPGEIRAVPEAA